MSKCICLFTFNMVFLVISIIMYSSSYGNYSEIIDYETSLWDLGAIVEVRSSTLGVGCPQGFENVEGMFWGTATTCKGQVGKCKTKSKAGQKSGAEEKKFSKFNTKILCFRRDPAQNYHDLVKYRKTDGSCESNEMKCGSKTDPEKLFCLTGSNQDICPKNSISFGLKTDPV